MPKVDLIFRPGRELDESRYLDFMALRPGAGARSEGAPGVVAAEDRPLHLDLAAREPQRRQPTTDRAYAAAAARATSVRRSRRRLLAAGLAAVVGLGVAVALWSYPALERRAAGDGALPAEPSAPPAGRPPQAMAAQQPVAVAAVKVPAPPDTPALAPSPVPDVAKPERKAPREMRRPQITSARPEASAATADANIREATAPASTLSAQLAAQAQSGGR
jgi:hypothetical protein